MVGLGQGIEAILEITIGISPTAEVKVEIEIDQAVKMKDKGPEQFQETRDRENRSTTMSRSSSHV